MKRNIFAILAVVCIIALLAACSPAAAPTEAPAEETAAATVAAEETVAVEATAAVEETAVATEAAPAEKIQIVTWHTLTDHHQEAYQAIIDAFNASQDKYEVVAQQQPWGEYDAKLLQAVSTGTAPDFVGMFPSEAINFIEDGYLFDLSV